MNPAFSVLVFTVASGAGYGMISLVVTMHLLGLIAPLGKQDIIVTTVIALVLVTLGLLSSTLHLAKPKNAWRAFSRFRTSWLSREGVFAVLYYPLVFAYLLCVWQSDTLTVWVTVTGLAVIGMGVATLFCTGMIYASLKTIPQWHMPLTPLNYMLLAAMSGAVLLLAIDAGSSRSEGLAACSIALLGLGLAAKTIYFYWIGKPSGSSIKTATTFSRSRVRLLDQGHSAGSFLNREFIFNLEPLHLLRLRWLALGLGFGVPLAAIGAFLQLGAAALTWVAALAMLCGLLLERWLFFAEARHVVRLYHGDQTV